MELKFEIYELKVKEQAVAMISIFVTIAIIAAFGLFMVFFSSLALGYYLNGLLESSFLGFVIIGLIYLFICILLLIFKDKLITNQLLQAFFSDTLTRDEDEQN